jgi:hypothetical protein
VVLSPNQLSVTVQGVLPSGGTAWTGIHRVPAQVGEERDALTGTFLSFFALTWNKRSGGNYHEP